MYPEDSRVGDQGWQSPEPVVSPTIKHSSSGFSSAPTPSKLINPRTLSAFPSDARTAGVSGSHQPLSPLQAQRVMKTNPAQWATTVLRGHPSPGPVQREPLEGTAKQQQLKNASRAPQAPSVPCQDSQHASPVGVQPFLPLVSPRALLASGGLCSPAIHRVGSQEAPSWISMDKWVRRAALSEQLSVYSKAWTRPTASTWASRSCLSSQSLAMGPCCCLLSGLLLFLPACSGSSYLGLYSRTRIPLCVW